MTATFNWCTSCSFYSKLQKCIINCSARALARLLSAQESSVTTGLHSCRTPTSSGISFVSCQYSSEWLCGKTSLRLVSQTSPSFPRWKTVSCVQENSHFCWNYLIFFLPCHPVFSHTIWSQDWFVQKACWWTHDKTAGCPAWKRADSDQRLLPQSILNHPRYAVLLGGQWNGTCCQSPHTFLNLPWHVVPLRKEGVTQFLSNFFFLTCKLLPVPRERERERDGWIWAPFARSKDFSTARSNTKAKCLRFPFEAENESDWLNLTFLDSVQSLRKCPHSALRTRTTHTHKISTLTTGESALFAFSCRASVVRRSSWVGPPSHLAPCFSSTPEGSSVGPMTSQSPLHQCHPRIHRHLKKFVGSSKMFCPHEEFVVCNAKSSFVF